MSRAKLWLAMMTANRYTWVLTCLVFVLLCFLSSAYHQAASSAGWSDHAYDVRRMVNDLRTEVSDAGAAARGVIVAGPSGYLDDYTRSKEACFRALADVREHTVDNPDQQARMTLAAVELTTKFAELDGMVRLTKDGNRAAAVDRFNTHLSRRVHTRLKVILKDAADQEERLAKSRRAVAGWLEVLAAALTGIFGIFFGWFLVQWRGEYNKLDNPPAPEAAVPGPLFRYPMPGSGRYPGV